MKKWFMCVVLCLLLPGCGTVTEKALPEVSLAGEEASEDVSLASPPAEEQSTGIPADSPVADDIIEEDFPEAWEGEDSGLNLNEFSLAYGFADQTGGRLLLQCYDTGDGPSFDADPNQFTLAIGPYGEPVSISYAGWQDATEQNDYRDSAYNFDNLSGFVFNAVGGRLQPDKTYVLTAEGPFAEALITLNPPAPARDDLTMRYQGMGLKTEDYIYTVKGRGVEWSELLSVTAEGGQIGLFLFEREGAEMLFSIVYLDGPDTLFWDNPAASDGWDVWRIDMGEEPGRFTPLFLARLDDSLVLALTWGAPEGESVVVLYEENGRLVEKDDYIYSRYWSPL